MAQWPVTRLQSPRESTATHAVNGWNQAATGAPPAVWTGRPQSLTQPGPAGIRIETVRPDRLLVCSQPFDGPPPDQAARSRSRFEFERLGVSKNHSCSPNPNPGPRLRILPRKTLPLLLQDSCILFPGRFFLKPLLVPIGPLRCPHCHRGIDHT